jgi:hypothetical protein
MFRSGRCGMLKLVESAVDVTGNQNITRAGNVIPFQCQAAISDTCPIGADLVGGFKGGNEMFGVGARSVSYAEVVNDQSEEDIYCNMSP